MSDQRRWSYEDGVRAAAGFVKGNVNNGELLSKQILAAFGYKDTP